MQLVEPSVLVAGLPAVALWQWAVEILLGLVLLVVLYGAALVFRRRWLARHGGTFDLSFRARSAKAGRGWVLGVGRYTDDVLEFFRIFSVLPRPALVFDRGDLTYRGRREPLGSEGHALYAGHVIIGCTTSRGDLELAMAPEAVTGFLAWLEATPPGNRQLPT
jgi:hypothetical protein